MNSSRVPGGWFAVGGGIVVVIVLALVINWMIGNGVTNEGNKKEAELSAQYLNNQNYLSDCIVRVRETAGVAKGQSAAFDKIISNAVQGRYTAGSSAQVGGGQLFSAITEAYPNLEGLGKTFQRVLETVNSCRTNFRDQQTTLLELVRDYNSWRTGSWTARHYGTGFPSENLVAQVGNNAVTGQAALIKMRTVIQTEDSRSDYENGTLEPEDPFDTDTTND